jgi:EAL domain-containing protein (putative c-di-GMP-specific phosphodiesterase class I)
MPLLSAGQPVGLPPHSTHTGTGAPAFIASKFMADSTNFESTPGPFPTGSDEHQRQSSRIPSFDSFQPQLSVLTGRITAIEILSHASVAATKLPRMRAIQEHERRLHLDQGIVAASRALKMLADNGHRHLSVCVTVPWTWIEDTRAITHALQVVYEANVAPYNLIVQISDETALVHVPSAINGIARLSRHGIQVSMANFGAAMHTHYHLRSLPVTSIRLDASLVDAGRKSRRDAVILRSLIDMVRQMNIRVTVDGINNQEDLAFVAQARVEIVQGNFITPPIHLDLLIPWLNTTNRLAASRTLNTLQRSG